MKEERKRERKKFNKRKNARKKEIRKYKNGQVNLFSEGRYMDLRGTGLWFRVFT